MLDLIEPGRRVSVERDTFPKLVADRPTRGVSPPTTTGSTPAGPSCTCRPTSISSAAARRGRRAVGLGRRQRSIPARPSTARWSAPRASSATARPSSRSVLLPGAVVEAGAERPTVDHRRHGRCRCRGRRRRDRRAGIACRRGRSSSASACHGPTERAAADGPGPGVAHAMMGAGMDDRDRPASRRSRPRIGRSRDERRRRRRRRLHRIAPRRSAARRRGRGRRRRRPVAGSLANLADARAAGGALKIHHLDAGPAPRRRRCSGCASPTCCTTSPRSRVAASTPADARRCASQPRCRCSRRARTHGVPKVVVGAPGHRAVRPAGEPGSAAQGTAARAARRAGCHRPGDDRPAHHLPRAGCGRVHGARDGHRLRPAPAPRRRGGRGARCRRRASGGPRRSPATAARPATCVRRRRRRRARPRRHRGQRAGGQRRHRRADHASATSGRLVSGGAGPEPVRRRPRPTSSRGSPCRRCGRGSTSAGRPGRRSTTGCCGSCASPRGRLPRQAPGRRIGRRHHRRRRRRTACLSASTARARSASTESITSVAGDRRVEPGDPDHRRLEAEFERASGRPAP